MKVPALRFNEFGGQEWQSQRLNSVLEKASKPVKIEPDKYYREIGIRSHGKGIFHKEPIKGNELGNKRVFWVQPDALAFNIVFAWEHALGVTSETENGFIASHRFPMYLPKDSAISTKFLKYLFLTEKGKSYLELASPGGAGRNKTLGQKNFNELVVTLPSLQEQTKIADLLTAIDDRISQLTQKAELLAQYKKGVMQQIFSQELRFKDDDWQDFPDWEEKEFRHFLSLTSREKPLTVSKTKLLSVKMHMNGVVKNENTGTLSLGATYFVRKSGQFIYGKQNVFNGAFGIVPEELDGFLSSTDVPSLEINRQNINPSFFLFYLGRREYYTNLESIASGSGSKRVHEEKFMSIKINLPSLREQTKIANFLTAITDKLAYTQTQLAAAKQYKQGLLQQMFV